MHISAGVLIINRAGTDPINDGFEKRGHEKIVIKIVLIQPNKHDKHWNNGSSTRLILDLNESKGARVYRQSEQGYVQARSS